MTDIGHVHVYDKRTPPVYRDGCHFTTVEKTCKDCGELVKTEVERDFGMNPLQIAFADRHCRECQRLARGYEPDAWVAEELSFP
jgi:hypothetical protein